MGAPRLAIGLWYAFWVALCLLLPATSQATPRYSARYHQSCGLCHVNPSGGGQRTLYATQYLVPGEMSARTYTPEQIAAIQPMIGNNLSIGLDQRTIYHHSDAHDPAFENFLQMQGTVSLAFQLNERFLAYLERGVSGTGEVYGLGYVLPFHGYVKVGRFVPSYGWRFDDHTFFVRQKALESGATSGLLGFGGAPAPQTDVGIEAGIFPRRLALTLGIINGNRGATLDNNENAAFVSQALYRFGIGDLGLGLGGSVFRNAGPGGRRTTAGPFGYLHYKPLVWLGQSDWSSLDPSTADDPEERDWSVSQEVTLRLLRGLELRGTHDFYDPDTKAKSGTRSRYGFGFHFMPYPFLGVLAMAERHDFDVPSTAAVLPASSVTDFTQVGVQIHLFY